MRTLRVVLGFALLLWTCAPAAAADEPAPACLEALKAQVTYRAEMTVTRVDGRTFAGWFERVNASEGTLRLKTFDSSAARFSSLDFEDGDIASLTFHRDTTSQGMLYTFVGAGAALGAIAGTELVRGLDGADSEAIRVGASLGLVGALLGLVVGVVVVPKTSTEVSLDCRPAP